MICSSSSFANTIAGPSASRRSRKRSGPKSRIALQEERSTLTPRRELGRAQGGGVDRATEQRVAGEVEVRAALEPGGSSSSARRSGETPRSEAIVRAPSAPTSETTVPVRPATTGPRTSTP